MIDTAFLNDLSKFNLIIKKRVTSNFSGAKKSVFQGKGMLFKDHRIYAPGDDFRAIDWKVYARTDDLMIKNFEEDKNLVVHIILDKSLSMNYGKKFDYACMLGVGFAYLTMKSNDKFQFATFSNDIDMYRPRRGMSQVMSMIDYLNKVKLQGTTDFLGISQKYRANIGSRSLIILISDFLVPIDEIKNGLYYFAGNEVKAIQVLDQKEKFPFMEGDFKLRDSESKELLRTYISPRSRDEYLHKLQEHSENIRNECNLAGFEFHSIGTETPIFDAFYSIFQ